MDHGLSHFHPHGMCYLWQPGLIWAQAITNGLIALAYFAIPMLLLYFIRRRPDIPNPLLFTLFSVFIFSCGTHHVMTIVTIWKPMYWTATFVDAVTALASIGTAAVLAPMMPRLLRSGTVENYLEAMSKAVLEDKNEALETANARLERVNADMQEQMALMSRSADALAAREERIKELREEVARLKAELEARGG